MSASLSPVIPTVGIVEWSAELDSIAGARVEFGLDSRYGMTAPVDLAAPGHRTLLLGMKPSRTYHFRIIAEGVESCVSDDYTLSTGPSPNGLPRLSVVEHRPDATEGGFLLTCFLRDGPAFILDADGDYVWWYGSGEMGRAALSHDGKHIWYAGVNVAGGRGSMKRVTLDGLTERDFSADFGDLHHDFTLLPDGTIAFIRHDGEHDLVVERAPDGTQSVVFDVANAHGGTSINHSNSIHYFAEDDTYTVSDLSQDAYVKVRRDGDVVWVLGGSTSDFSGDGATWDGQHGHHVLAPDRLLLFSNGLSQAPSLAIEVSLDLSLMTATRVWEYEGGERSIIFGDVARLPNGNTLVAYSSLGIVHEVSPGRELVRTLAWDLGGAIGYVAWLDSLYEPTAR